MNLSRETQRSIVIVLLVLWCTTLLAVCNYLSSRSIFGHSFVGSKSSLGLLWNLFLALIPLFWSWVFRTTLSHRRPILACLVFFLWLLFIPNAPYLLTDMVHLGYRPAVPLWCRLATLLSFAGTGALLGYYSLMDVQTSIEQQFGKTMGWLLAIGSLIASGFGIYLGRFLRWNSWDALTQPRHFVRVVIGQFIEPGPHPHPIPVTIVFSVALIIGYLALRSITAQPTNRFEAARK